MADEKQTAETTAAPSAENNVQFGVTDLQVITNAGDLKARFTLNIPGVGSIYRCGYFRKSDGERFVTGPSFNKGTKDNPETGEKTSAGYIKSMSLDRNFNPRVTAAVEAALTAALPGTQPAQG